MASTGESRKLNRAAGPEEEGLLAGNTRSANAAVSRLHCTSSASSAALNSGLLEWLKACRAPCRDFSDPGETFTCLIRKTASEVFK